MFNLKEFRTDKKIKQSDLAAWFGVGQSFVSQVENGKDPMPDAWYDKIAEQYGPEDIARYMRDDDTEFETERPPGDADENLVTNPKKMEMYQKNFESILNALERRDAQMDRLIRVIEKMQGISDEESEIPKKRAK